MALMDGTGMNHSAAHGQERVAACPPTCGIWEVEVQKGHHNRTEDRVCWLNVSFVWREVS